MDSPCVSLIKWLYNTYFIWYVYNILEYALLHSLCTEVKSSLICSWLSITEYCRHHLYIQICTWIFAEIDPLEWKYLNVFFNIYCNFRFPKYINLFNEIKMFFLLENFEISAGKLFLISCKSAVIDVYTFISPNFATVNLSAPGLMVNDFLSD